MKKFSLPIAADILFYAFSAWLFTLCLLRGLRLPYPLAFAVAALVGVAFGMLSALLLLAKRRKRALTKREAEARDALLLHLALEKPEGVRAALLGALVADGREVHCAEGALEEDGTRLLPLFTMEPVGADEIARLLREFGTQPFTVLCNALSPDAERLLASFGRRAVCGDEVYALFARTGKTPSPLLCGEIPRKTVKQKLRRTFSRSNARPFFIGGVLLLVMSLFTLFPVYYIVTGAVLLGSAVTIRLFGAAA